MNDINDELEQEQESEDLLPNSIFVALFKDIFWNANSDLYPTTAPNINLYTEIQGVRPVFFTPHNATIVLTGDFNHCIYNDKYYKLVKLKVLDIATNTYEYQLNEDFMINFIFHGGEIRGKLTKTNRPEILDDCIETTERVLETPAKVNIFNFLPVKATWKETAKVILWPEESVMDFLDAYISDQDWENIKRRLKVNLYINSLKKKKWNTSKEAWSQRHSYNPLFIIDCVSPSIGLSWKARVLGKVAQFLKDWKDKKITKVSIFSGSHLEGKECITYEENTFSLGNTLEEQLDLREVDLSNIQDVVLLDANGTPIDEKNPNSSLYREPDLTKDLLSDELVLAGGTPEIPYGWYAKLCRYPYLPLRPQNDSFSPNRKFLPVDSTEYGKRTYKNYEKTYYTGAAPQHLKFKSDLEIADGWLWHINKLDFAMVVGFGSGYSETYEPFRYRSYFDENKAKWGDYYFFRKLPREKIPGVGYLIYQIEYNWKDWDEYEYIGIKKPKSFTVRTGLNKSILKITEDPQWKDTPHNLRLINGNSYLSLFTLKTDLFNWICFAPSARDYLYKWTPNDYFQHYIFYPGRTPQYPSEFLDWDVGIDKNKQISSPHTTEHDRIGNFRTAKELEYAKISLRDILELDKPINQGDIFVSDLEWRWKQTEFQMQDLPFEIDAEYLKYASQYIEAAAGYTGKAIAGLSAGSLAYYMSTGLKSAAKFAYQTGKIQRTTALAFKYGFQEFVKESSGLAARGIRHAAKYGSKYINPMRSSNVRWFKDRIIYAKRDLKALKAGGTAIRTAWKARSTIAAARAALTAARAVAAAKTLGIALAVEGVIWGLTKLYEDNQPDDEKRLLHSIWTMGDFFKGEEENTAGLDRSIVFYLHKGKLKYGLFKQFKRTFNLSSDQDQIIEEVEGTTSKEITYTHITYLGDLDYKQEEIINRGVETSTFKKAYQGLRESEKILNVTDADLEDPLNNITFDLVGTKWYAQFWKGRVHLIAKDLTPFDNKTHVNTREIEYPPGESPSVYAKINQKSDLVVFSSSFPINTKYTYDPQKDKQDRHFLKVSGLRKELANLISDDLVDDLLEKVENKGKSATDFQKEKTERQNKLIEHDDSRDFYHIQYQTPFDYINLAVSVFQTKGVELQKINTYQLEQLKNARENEETQYRLATEAYDHKVSNIRLKTARLLEDIDYNSSQHTQNSIYNVLSTTVQGGLGGAVAGNIPGAIIGAGIGFVGSAANTIFGRYQLSTRNEILKQRYKQDEISDIRSLTLNHLSRKSNYEHTQRDFLIRLNSLTNTYIKPSINDDDVQRVINKINKWDNIHIKNYLPTPEQEKIITDIYSQFGCLCNSDWFIHRPLFINNKMEEGLYQFSNLDTSSIKSKYTSDLVINEIIRNVFTTGTKFINVQHEPLQIETQTFIVPKGQPLEFDTTKLEEWDDKLWDIYTISQPKTEILKILKQHPKYGLTDAEYEANKDKLEGKDGDELVNLIREITTNRRQGSVHVLAAPTKEFSTAAELTQLKATVDSLTKDKEELTREVEDLTDQRDHYIKLLNEHREDLDIHTDVKDSLSKQLRELDEQKKKLEKDLEIVNIELQQVTQQNLSCANRLQISDSELNTAREQIRRLTAEKTKLTSKINNLNTQIKTLTAEKVELQTRITALEATVKELEAQISKLSTQKGDIETSLSAKEQENTDLKQKLEEAQSTGGATITCAIMRELTADAIYKIDIQESENKETSKYLDLLLEIADNTYHMQLSLIKDNVTTKYPQMKPAIEAMDVLMQHQAIAKALEIANMPGFKHFQLFKTTAVYPSDSTQTSQINKIRNKVNDIKRNYSSPGDLHWFKDALDEGLYRIQLAREALVEERKTDEELDHFFTHFFPGQNIIELYKSLFKLDPQIAVIKKKFNDLDCPNNPLQWLNISKELTKVVSDKLPEGGSTSKQYKQIGYYDGHPLMTKGYVAFNNPQFKDPFEKRYAYTVGYNFSYVDTTRVGTGWLSQSPYYAKATMTLGTYNPSLDTTSTIESTRSLEMRTQSDYFNDEVQKWWTHRDGVTITGVDQQFIDSKDSLLITCQQRRTFSTSYSDYYLQSNYSWRTYQIDLIKIFGKQKALLAWKLMIIQNVFSHGFIRTGMFDSKASLHWRNRDDFFPDFWDSSTMTMNWSTNTATFPQLGITKPIQFTDTDFISMRQFLNYVNTALHNPDKPLMCKYTSSSGITGSDLRYMTQRWLSIQHGNG